MMKYKLRFLEFSGDDAILFIETPMNIYEKPGLELLLKFKANYPWENSYYRLSSL